VSKGRKRFSFKGGYGRLTRGKKKDKIPKMVYRKRG